MKNMLLKLFRWVFLTPSGMNAPAENVRIATILNGANILGMLLLFIAAMYIINHMQVIIIIFNTFLFFLLAVNFTLFKVFSSLKIYRIISTIAAETYGLFNFICGGFSGLGQFWLLAVLPLFYVFTGYKWGTVIAWANMALYMVVFLTGNCRLASAPCTQDFIFTFTHIYIFISIFSFILEYSRFRAQKDYNDLIMNLDILSRTDELTGLLNRRGIMEFMKYEFRKYLRNETGFVICFCDIDHFKKVNDTYGHDAGDTVLRELSRFIKQQLRAGDFISRWGGEEFIILMRETSIIEGARIIERVRRAIESRRFDAGGASVQITVSFGMSETGDTVILDDLINYADERLYRAKEQGRNRVVYS